jgi:hypothetical protein
MRAIVILLTFCCALNGHAEDDVYNRPLAIAFTENMRPFEMLRNFSIYSTAPIFPSPSKTIYILNEKFGVYDFAPELDPWRAK